MNGIISTIVIIVLLGLIIENLDARKIERSLSKDRKQLEKSRSKRQFSQFYSGYTSRACNYDVANPCKNYVTDLSNSGVSLEKSVTNAKQKNFYISGYVTISALQNGGMCAPKSNLLTANAYSAIYLGHITLPQLATLDLFPVQSVDADKLQNAGYTSTVGDTTLLSSLGMQASMFGHIVPSQLQSLNLYPLQAADTTSDNLMQAGYLTNDCVPTALGLSALHTQYMQTKDLATLGCQTDDSSQLTLPQLSSARYISGRSNILTPIGLAAVHTGYISKATYQTLGIYPYAAKSQIQSSDDGYQEQSQSSSAVNDFVQAGYLHKNSYLLTGAGYHGIASKYFNVDNFRNINVWPYPGTPSMSAFISAGYATYSGHLTSLGYSLLHAQYFPYEWLAKLGIQLHDEYRIFHDALRYGGFLKSDYSNAHTTNPINVYSSGDTVQDGQYQLASAPDMLSSTDSTNVNYIGN